MTLSRVALMVLALGAASVVPEAFAAEKSAEKKAEKAADPVVATVNGQTIHLSEMKAFIKALPEPMNMTPVEQVFPQAQEQMVIGTLIDQKATKTDLANDPEVKARLAFLTQNVIRTAYVEREVEKRLTDAKVKAAYDDFLKGFQKTEETKAQHILVDDEAKAKEVITKLDGGAKFEDLVKDYSKDKGAGGDGSLGYFGPNDMVKEFSEAAFATKPGTYTKTPVKTAFGWHVIKVNDRRAKQPPTFAEMKDVLRQQLKQGGIDEMIKDYRSAAKIELFDVNGAPVQASAVQPAAGDQKK